MLFSACGLWRSQSSEPSNRAADAPAELRSGIPFSTKEPEVFQAEMIVTAGGTTRSTFLARSGFKRRYDYDFGAKNQLTVIAAEKVHLLVPQAKIFAEAAGAENFSLAPADDWQNFLTTGWLNAKMPVKFDKLETEDDLTRYKVLTDDKNFSEILIAIDEKLQLPVKQEFYTGGGAEKSLVFAMELKNIKLEAEENLFALPPDFRRVSAEELRRLWRGIQN